MRNKYFLIVLICSVLISSLSFASDNWKLLTYSEKLNSGILSVTHEDGSFQFARCNFAGPFAEKSFSELEKYLKSREPHGECTFTTDIRFLIETQENQFNQTFEKQLKEVASDLVQARYQDGLRTTEYVLGIISQIPLSIKFSLYANKYVEVEGQATTKEFTPNQIKLNRIGNWYLAFTGLFAIGSEAYIYYSQHLSVSSIEKTWTTEHLGEFLKNDTKTGISAEELGQDPQLILDILFKSLELTCNQLTLES